MLATVDVDVGGVKRQVNIACTIIPHLPAWGTGS
jgi:hydrogenase maturation factor